MFNSIRKDYSLKIKAFLIKMTTPSGLADEEGIRYWQERLLLVFLFAGVVLGFVVCLASVVLSIIEDLWGVAVVDTIIYAWVVVLFFCRSFPFVVRAISVSLISYVLGMVLLLTIGPFGGGPVWLFVFPVIVAILLGLRPALGALAVNAGTVILIGILLQSGYMEWDYSTTNPFEKWIVISLNFMLLNSIVTISIAVISGRTQGLLNQQKSMLALLEEKHSELLESNFQIKREMIERIQAEDALLESEEKYRLLVENQNDLIVKVDTKWRFLYVSPKYCETYGKDEEELLGKNILPLVHEEDRSRIAESLERLHYPPYTAQHEERTLTKDGWRWFSWGAKGLLNEEGQLEAFVSVGRDITDRKQTEEEKQALETQLQRSQKMEAMGLMAGGVAHDLNNILSGIVSYPELILMDLPDDSPLRKPIKTIQESGMKAVDVVSDLLTIARGIAVGKEVLSLNNIVEEYLSSAEHQKLKTVFPIVTFKFQFDSELLNINCSPSHITKTLMNLVANASEAIEGAGTVTISTESRYLDEPLKAYEEVKIGEYSVLGVTDDGTGISPEDLEKIFEPFYTKKVMGRSGTGLGLAIVWNMVQDHQGYINVMSSEKGTIFELYFPVTREEVAAAKENIPLKDYLGQGEKILVVDDEERQIEIACGMLTRLGYNAKSVQSGEEAIEYVKKHSVDLMVLDMVMHKGINGRETYEKIIRIHPGQKAIIASGYAKTKEVEFTQKLGAGKYIKKPYTLEKIGIAVKEELEK